MKKKIIFFTLKKRSFYDFFSARGVQKVRLHFSSLIYRIYQKKIPKKNLSFWTFLTFSAYTRGFFSFDRDLCLRFSKKKGKILFLGGNEQKTEKQIGTKKNFNAHFFSFFPKKTGKTGKNRKYVHFILLLFSIFFFCFLLATTQK